jgi:hypothetical protein
MGLREKRLEFFLNEVAPIIKGGQDIRCPNGHEQFIFDTRKEYFGTINFYPKANVFHSFKRNEWYRGDAMLYIINNCVDNKKYVLNKYKLELTWKK